MRIGHPQIKEGDDYMLQLFGGYLEERKDRISVLNVGAGSGYFARQLAGLLANRRDRTRGPSGRRH